VPVLGVELAGDDRRAGSVAILENFEEIAPLGIGDRSNGKIVEHEEVESREASQDAREGAVGPGEAQLVEESRRAAVGSTMAVATSLVSEGAREVGLAGACCTRDEHAVVLLDPSAGGELAQHGLVEIAARVALDTFDARLAEPELGLLESAPDALGLASHPLRFDEQREALVEGHGLDVGVALLLIPRSGHRQEAKRLESFESWFFEHFDFLQW